MVSWVIFLLPVIIICSVSPLFRHILLTIAAIISYGFSCMVRIRKSDNRNQSIIIDGTLHKWLFFTSFFTNITSRFITPANRDNYQFGFRDCLFGSMVCFEKRDFVFIKFWIFSLDPAIRRYNILKNKSKANHKSTMNDGQTEQIKCKDGFHFKEHEKEKQSK